MKIDRIYDINSESLNDEVYDLAVFASGYETRCIYAPKNLNSQCFKEIVVFGFEDVSHPAQRRFNDLFYRNSFNKIPMNLNSNDDGLIYKELNKFVSSNKQDSFHFLVDYSSMSRIWYSGIINWVLHASNSSKFILDFVYTRGTYEDYIPPIVINDILSIPGCEGGGIKHGNSIAVFGLGFYGLAALCVLDRLEADIVFAYVAKTNSKDDYDKKVREINKELIQHHATETLLELPINSVEKSYQNLAELIAPYRNKSEITFVPMGPKPQVLASILLAMKFPEVTCLRVSAKPPPGDPLDIKAEGSMSSTRIELVKAQPGVIH
jgi:hypothetical protein